MEKYFYTENYGLGAATICEIIDDYVEVYNLHGQKVGDSLEGLPRGIYIVNKKKVFVK